jgi:hypothetical protein
MPKKDRNITPSVTHKLQSLGYNVADWDDSQTETKLTAQCLRQSWFLTVFFRCLNTCIYFKANQNKNSI